MDIGVMVGGGGLAAVIDAVREAADAGVRRAWLPQLFGIEALTAIAVAGRQVPGVELGTAVVPTYPRHPLVLAGQALTASAALGPGRLHLGIGLSHQRLMRKCWGMPSERRPSPLGSSLRAWGRGLRGGPAKVSGRRPG